MENSIEKNFFEYFNVDNFDDLRKILADKDNEKTKEFWEIINEITK